MFENSDGPTDGLDALAACLDELDQDVPDTVRVDRLRKLEEIKSKAAAAQAREAVAFAESQRAEQLAVGVKTEHADRGIAAQVALAMRTSPWKAQRLIGWARILTTELPRTFAALCVGEVTERRAMIVARETIWLSREHRATLDAELAPRLAQLGDRKLEAETKTIAYRLDPAGFVQRAAQAEQDACVTVRPAPDTMARLATLTSVTKAVAAYASLNKAADTAIAAGDQRSRGKIMADTLIERVTGQATADAIPVEVNVVMTDRSLLAPDAPGGDEPALIDGNQPIPAEIARALVKAPDDTPIWLRRLYAGPDRRELIAMESKRRAFTPAQRRFIQLRDRTCRTPWCDAPIRHTDHVTAAADGGPTAVDNAQGYCETCNHAKQAPGWRTTVTSRAGPHEVETITPTGHRYRSRAPDVPRVA
ncbi:MAG: hypothetical protein QOG80_596 [Pseudonocardiales bacterium]|jgi:hypothetical protein|nr:hypothetical protein [Pseudonocardiales bacterium]